MPENVQKPSPMAAGNLGAVGRSPLHWIWICDVSDSMNMNGKIDRLNEAIQKGNEELVKYSEKSDFKIFLHTLKFSTGAEWMEKDFIPASDYQWKSLTADGVTDLGEALSKVADILQPRDQGGVGIMPNRCKLPHIVLITDGYPTDDWESGLKKMESTFWGENAVRIAVALDGADMEVLTRFVGNVDEEKLTKRLVKADNPAQLIECIIDVSQMVRGRVAGENYGPATRATPPPAPPQDTPLFPPPQDEAKQPGDAEQKAPPKDTGSPENPPREEITVIPEDVEYQG